MIYSDSGDCWLGTVVMAERTPAKFSFHRPVFHDAVNQSWFDDLDLKQLQKRDEKRQLKRNGELQTSGHLHTVHFDALLDRWVLYSSQTSGIYILNHLMERAFCSLYFQQEYENTQEQLQISESLLQLKW